MANDAYLYPEDPLVIGKRGATASRTEDGVVKQFDRFILEDRRTRRGVYICQTGLHAILATAQTFPAGSWFLINPVDSGIKMALRRIEFMCSGTAAAATLPRLLLQRATFTGTASGALVTPAKHDTNDLEPIGSLRTANTGLTMTAGAHVYSFLPVVIITAAAGLNPATADWLPEGEGQPILAPGEALVFTQPLAGTSSDSRRFVTNVAWDEFTEF